MITFDEKNELSLNIGDYITFYISQNKQSFYFWVLLFFYIKI